MDFNKFKQAIKNKFLNIQRRTQSRKALQDAEANDFKIDIFLVIDSV